MNAAVLATVTGLAFACLGSGGARASLIQDGNFTSGLTGWTATGNVTTTTVPYFGLASNFPSGTVFAVFNAGNATPNGVISQSFSTVAGTNYSLSFDYGSNGAAQTIIAALANTAGATVLANQSDTANGSGTLSAYSLTFTAVSSSTTLSFSDYTGNPTANTDGGLYGVSVQAVPEPESLALLAIGTGSLLARRRRRSN
jgi:hypothetical protein